MSEHTIEVYKKNIINPEDNFTYFVDAVTIEEAAVKAIEVLDELYLSLSILNIYDWYAKIIDHKGEDYQILRKGELIVNPNTGARLSDLEEKLN